MNNLQFDSTEAKTFYDECTLGNMPDKFRKFDRKEQHFVMLMLAQAPLGTMLTNLETGRAALITGTEAYGDTDGSYDLRRDALGPLQLVAKSCKRKLNVVEGGGKDWASFSASEQSFVASVKSAMLSAGRVTIALGASTVQQVRKTQ